MVEARALVALHAGLVFWFMVNGAGFRVQGPGFRVQGSRLLVLDPGLGIRV